MPHDYDPFHPDASYPPPRQPGDPLEPAVFEPQPDRIPATASVGEFFVEPDHDNAALPLDMTPIDDQTVAAVLAWVGSDPARAQTALQLEKQGRARRTLINELVKIVDA